MWHLRGGLPEESDRAERVKTREEFQDCGVLPFLRDKPGGRTPCLHERTSDGQRPYSIKNLENVI